MQKLLKITIFLNLLITTLNDKGNIYRQIKKNTKFYTFNQAINIEAYL